MGNSLGLELDVAMQLFPLTNEQQFQNRENTCTFSQTIFLGLGQGIKQGAEVFAQTKMSLNGTIKKMFVTMPSSNTLDAPLTITLRKNGIDTPTLAIIPALNSVDQEINIETKFLKDDLLGTKFVNAATVGAVTLFMVYFVEWEKKI